jgi:hypothetical protein
MTRRVLLGLLVILGLVTQASQPDPATDTAESRGARLIELEEQNSYRIVPADIVLILVPTMATMNMTVTMKTDGAIYLPPPPGTIYHPIIRQPPSDIPDIRAVGLTALELRDVLAQKLGLQKPMISVRVIHP